MSDPMKQLGRALHDARQAFGPLEVYPAPETRRLTQAEMAEALAGFRPRQTDLPPRPWLAIIFLMMIAAGAGYAAGAFLTKAMANGNATAAQAQEERL